MRGVIDHLGMMERVHERDISTPLATPAW